MGYYIVEIFLFLTMYGFACFAAGHDYAQRKAWDNYEQWRLARSRERLNRIRRF